eukprot:gene2036-1226_t
MCRSNVKRGNNLSWKQSYDSRQSNLNRETSNWVPQHNKRGRRNNK